MQDEPSDTSRFSDSNIPDEDKRAVMEMLEQDWEDNGSYAIAYQLGRVWRDGLGVPPDNRPLAKLNGAIKIADASNQGEAKSKAFSTIAVTL